MWPYGLVAGLSLSAVVLLVLLILAVALFAAKRHQLAAKFRRHRGRRAIDGDSDRHDDPEQAQDETCKRLLDPVVVRPTTAAVTTPCGGIEFYLKVVTPDSAGGDKFSPSSASSGNSDLKLERRLGDGSTCYDRDLICATLKREVAVEASDCDFCQCLVSPSSFQAPGTAPTPDWFSTSDATRSWTSCRDRRSGSF